MSENNKETINKKAVIGEMVLVDMSEKVSSHYEKAKIINTIEETDLFGNTITSLLVQLCSGEKVWVDKWLPLDKR